MGQYINRDSKGNGILVGYFGKVSALIADSATRINGNEYVPNMFCVVNNGMFAAAGYMYDNNEYLAFSDLCDSRPKTWLIHPNAEEIAD